MTCIDTAMCLCIRINCNLFSIIFTIYLVSWLTLCASLDKISLNRNTSWPIVPWKLSKILCQMAYDSYSKMCKQTHTSSLTSQQICVLIYNCCCCLFICLSIISSLALWIFNCIRGKRLTIYVLDLKYNSHNCLTHTNTLQKTRALSKNPISQEWI